MSLLKKSGLLLFVFVFLLSTFIPVHRVYSDSIQDRYIILFKDKIDEKIIGTEHLNVVYKSNSIPMVTVSSSYAVMERLAHNPNILTIRKDEVLTLKEDWGIEDAITPVLLQKQAVDWGISRLHIKNAWDSGYTGQNVKVAVVDTGIDIKHDDLVVTGGASFVSYTSSYNDDNGHGTHVAGIIGAKDNDVGVIGVAPKSKLYAVKVIDQNGLANVSDVIAGIDWAITNHMDIINLSLGSNQDNPAIQAIVDKAYQNGILVVAAAGNEGKKSGKDTVVYPARYDSVIAVAATDITDDRSSFSSFGKEVEFTAPGDRILSTFLNNSYARINGTSMAAPYVSGTLALLKQAHPTFTAGQLRALLQQQTIDLGKPGRDPYYGFGLIQSFYDEPINDQSTASKQRQFNQDHQNQLYLPDQLVSLYVDETDQSVYVLTKKHMLILDKDTFKIKKEMEVPNDMPNQKNLMQGLKVKGDTIYLMTSYKFYSIQKGTLEIKGGVSLTDSFEPIDSFEIDGGKAYVFSPDHAFMEIINIQAQKVEKTLRMHSQDFAVYKNKIYFGMPLGLMEYDVSTGTTKKIGKSTHSVTLDREEGILYCISNEFQSSPELRAMNLTTGKIETLSLDSPTFGPNYQIQHRLVDNHQLFIGGHVFEDGDLSIPIGKYKGYYIRSINSKYFVSADLNYTHVYDRKNFQWIISYPNKGGTWIDLDGNFYEEDPKENSLVQTRLNGNETFNQALPETNVSSMPIKAYYPTDIQRHWAFELLKEFLNADILHGYVNLDGSYRINPDSKISRAEFTALLVRTLNLKADGQGKSFSDVKKSDWFYDPIRIASQISIISGVAKNEFQPNRPITRAEMASIITRIFSSSLTFDGVAKEFTDIDGYWAEESIIMASKAGIIGGYPDNTFRPKYPAKRAEAVVMLARSLQKERVQLAPSDSFLINVVSQYEYERIRRIQNKQFTDLPILNSTLTTGYMQSYIQNYDASINELIKAGYQFDASLKISLTAKVIRKTDRFAKMELNGPRYSISTTYHGNFINGKNFQGIYFLKKTQEGDWKIYNFTSYK